MPTQLDLSIDVSEAVGLGEPLQTRATVVMPEPDVLGDPPVVCFGFPGGGYCRAYFTFDMPGASGGGEAGWHVARGWVFVACDHLCVGDSDTPTDAANVTFEQLAAANHAMVTEVLARLARGSLADGFPAVTDPVKLGIGQSMGGSFTIVQQGQHRTFDAIGVLGSSAIQTRLWTAPGTPEVSRAFVPRGSSARVTDFTPDDAPIPLFAVDDSGLPSMAAGFHYDDVPRDIVAADLVDFPFRRGAMPEWGTAKSPACAISLLSPEVVAPEAAVIDVPVLVGVGERDVVPHPHEEPRAYQRSPDVTVYICPRMAHMHNFASTREAFWQRLHHWGSGVAETRYGERGWLRSHAR
jgi:pimeloyl-ACP methyl ester carboxylesterase